MHSPFACEAMLISLECTFTRMSYRSDLFCKQTKNSYTQVKREYAMYWEMPAMSLLHSNFTYKIEEQTEPT